MFVVSMKTSKKKVLFVVLALVVLAGIAVLLLTGSNGGEYAVCSLGKYSVAAADNQQRIEFLHQFGWQVQEEPVEIGEVSIPAEFNETYEAYNEIQKAQGLDLSEYCAQSCKRWSYEVLNYPGQTQGVRANLLVLDGKVIGGDISSVELDGFMHGFVNPSSSELNQPPASSTLPTEPATSSAAEGSTSSAEPSNPDSSEPAASTQAPVEPDSSSGVEETGGEVDLATWTQEQIDEAIANGIIRSTERDTLAPDPDMPNAPTD